MSWEKDSLTPVFDKYIFLSLLFYAFLHKVILDSHKFEREGNVS